MRKSRILTFLFALWPGAGQMYLGYMKRGVSLMGIFCLLISITGFLNLSFLFFLLPVIWFYAFFDTLNLRSMSYEFLPQDDFSSIWIRCPAARCSTFSRDICLSASC